MGDTCVLVSPVLRYRFLFRPGPNRAGALTTGCSPCRDVDLAHASGIDFVRLRFGLLTDEGWMESSRKCIEGSYWSSPIDTVCQIDLSSFQIEFVCALAIFMDSWWRARNPPAHTPRRICERKCAGQIPLILSGFLPHAQSLTASTSTALLCAITVYAKKK